jgi:polyribonucleotide nucleotidyltransferase
LLTDLGGESKGKEPRRVHAYIPHQIPKKKASKFLQENHQEKALKINKKNEREQHIQALRNHAESSIHHKEVHTRSSFPPDHPSLSQDLTMNLSSKSYRNPRENRKENRKTNEIGFQEMVAILSSIGLYGGNRNSKMPLLAN